MTLSQIVAVLGDDGGSNIVTCADERALMRLLAEYGN